MTSWSPGQATRRTERRGRLRPALALGGGGPMRDHRHRAGRSPTGSTSAPSAVWYCRDPDHQRRRRRPADFDAWEVDPSTVVFGPLAAAPHSHAQAEDVDDDGDLDMVLRFRFGPPGSPVAIPRRPCAARRSLVRRSQRPTRFVTGLLTVASDSSGHDFTLFVVWRKLLSDVAVLLLVSWSGLARSTAAAGPSSRSTRTPASSIRRR